MKIWNPQWSPGARTQSIVTASMLLLLPLLAALQYRWLGQLSEGDREQMKTNLRAVAGRFCRDFDLEMTRTYAAFLPDRGLPGDDKARDYAMVYERWAGSTTHPGLIKSVFLTNNDGNRQLKLTRLNIDSRQFEPCDWPDELKGVQSRLEQFTSIVRRGYFQPLENNLPGVRSQLFPPQRLNEDIPAFIIPFIEPGKLRGNGQFSIPFPAGHAIVLLDLTYIQQEMLPGLLKRHFAGEDRHNYDLTIVRRRDRGRIFQQFDASDSAEASGRDLSSSDVSAPLFTLNLDEIRTSLRSRFSPAQLAVAPRRGVIKRNSPPLPAMAFGSVGISRIDEMSGIWELHIRHRAGSLGAAVSKARRRNLIISFGILALLASSVGLIVLSSRRARRLAQQQIDFVAGISHELRTPLAVIDSAAYNLDKGVVREDRQIRSYGALIRKETGRLTEMVEQVLEFAGVQSGNQKYDLLPTNLNEVIDEALSSSQPLFEEGNFLVEKAVSPHLPLVMAERSAMARAVQNLLSNAMKYGNGSRHIGLFAETDGAVVQIAVIDRGLGIPSEELPHIFEPFFRGNEIRSAQIRGNGLGLSLVKNIVDAHGGSISVKSKPGEGSSFIIILPVLAET